MPHICCNTCGYCEIVNEEKGIGTCRINPPTVITFDIEMVTKTVFPTVNIHKDWCGSYMSEETLEI
ncbi:MAG TPA: hypothetical protein VI911_02360 [Patescibacteria group bacterium]|nr:hypothetical protein [Patescibacteria group bacterium]